MLPVIVQALTEPGEDGAGGVPPPGGVPNPNGQPQQQNANRNTSSSNEFGANTGGGQSFSEELSTQAVDTAPQAVTIGNAKIISDQRSNSIIILGNREVVVKVMKILDEMDISAPQVALSTVIGELTLSNSEEFGVDFLQRFKRFEGPSNSTGGIGAVSRNSANSGSFPWMRSAASSRSRLRP